jgi:hypothetical protein
MIDPQVVAANFEKAYTASGSPENDIISKFLDVVTSRVPELMDLLACFFPTCLVENPEIFKTEFPRVVDATLSELRMIQLRASKENGYKSRGLYDRVTNCIAGKYCSCHKFLLQYEFVSDESNQWNPEITPYKNVLADPLSVANMPNAGQSSSNDVLSSKPSAKKAEEFRAAATWTCKCCFELLLLVHYLLDIIYFLVGHKCGNDNMATKARCSTCQVRLHSRENNSLRYYYC